MPLILIGWLVSLPMVLATVTVGQPDCPQHFEGRVKKVIAENDAASTFAVDRVEFANVQILKGEVPQRVMLEVVQGGPFELVPGQDYRVQMRDGKLCWLEEI